MIYEFFVPNVEVSSVLIDGQLHLSASNYTSIVISKFKFFTNDTRIKLVKIGLQIPAEWMHAEDLGRV